MGGPDGRSVTVVLLAATSSSAKRAGESVAVVELFTSQGCSSCPPADALLSEIGTDPSLGSAVVPLAFHVDYWDYIGWTDPFSSSRWSERQRRYAQVLHLSTVYTPQVVVNGRQEAVGSNRRALRSLISDALGRDAGVEVGLITTGRSVSVSTVVPPGLERPELFVALVQNGIVTRVQRGENGGRTLRNDFVVRQLQQVGELARGTSTHSATFDLGQSIPPRHLQVVAFVQDPRTLEIYGAARATLYP